MIFKYVLYGLLIFLVIQMIRTTMRIKSNVRQSREEEEDKDAPKPPVLNIPDIEDARFEDLTGSDEESTDKAKDQPKEPPEDSQSPHR